CHLSSAEQVLETAALYFRPRDSPLALEFSEEDLGPSLRWEAVEARGGQHFPHYYGQLPRAALRASIELIATEGGTFRTGDRTEF
ncbi:MAG: DUF952 domain-containing protein, partial [Myxococcota bacterium]|nr:DUF952 domain-containing protein [Myxococcota bacterium]